MLTLSSRPDTRRVVAEQADGSWTVRLRARDGAQWWTAAGLLDTSGWPIDRDGLRCWVPAADATLDGDVLRVRGCGDVDGHSWRVVDAYAFEGETLRLTREWTHEADESQDGLDVLIEARCPAVGETQFVLPGISYDGNPNAGPERVVPRFPPQRPARCLYEEHRFPVPMVSWEWDGAAGRSWVALISQPSRIGAEEADHWWSLGLALDDAHGVLTVASGAVETNGRRNVVYGAQGRLIDVDGWALNAGPGAILRKEVRIECGIAASRGHGFRQGLWRAHALFEPRADPALSLAKFIALKLNALRARYVEHGDAAGFLCVPKKNVFGRGPYFQWGWVGQALRASWCALHEGRQRGKAYLETMARRPADFFVAQPLPSGPSRLVALRYALDEGRWVHRELDGVEVESTRQFGEAFTNLARLVELGRRLGIDVASWRERLCRAADFLCGREAWTQDGLLPHAWRFDGSPLAARPSAAGAPCISALALAGVLTGADRYRVAARELMAAYHRTFLADLTCPPWGATLDARCEDKEAGLFLLAAALDCHDSFGEGRFLDWARAAADWCLTFYYVWDVGFPPGKPCRGRLSSVGWPSVSVQNHHLDAFACPTLFLRLGRATGDVRYERVARTIAWAATQAVARKGHPWGFNRPECHNVAGEQGEALFHTNYWQGRGDARLWRGGHNTWNPLWVCALPLHEAILLRDAGWT